MESLSKTSAAGFRLRVECTWGSRQPHGTLVLQVFKFWHGPGGRHVNIWQKAVFSTRCQKSKSEWRPLKKGFCVHNVYVEMFFLKTRLQLKPDRYRSFEPDILKLQLRLPHIDDQLMFKTKARLSFLFCFIGRLKWLNRTYWERNACLKINICKSLISNQTDISPYSAGIDFSRQNLTSVDVRFWRLKSIPALTLVVRIWRL